jgi:aconitate hydratase
VKLTGKLSGWTSPKDVILKLCGHPHREGRHQRIIEYFGDGRLPLGHRQGTITNMGAELGATTSIFPYDDRMGPTCGRRSRGELADVGRLQSPTCSPPIPRSGRSRAYYDRVIEIDLRRSGAAPGRARTPRTWRIRSRTWPSDTEAEDYPTSSARR